jgi:hypothetical protein
MYCPNTLNLLQTGFKLVLIIIQFEEKSIEKLSTHTANHTTITVLITLTLSYLVLLF